METINHQDIVNWLPVRKSDAYKNKLGHVLCVGGSRWMAGAIMLSSMAAVRSGAGLVTVASDLSNKTSIHTKIPEAMFTDMGDDVLLTDQIQKADTVLLGPGLGQSELSRRVYELVLSNINSQQILVMDADALNLYSKFPIKLKAKETIITPHLGEWQALSGLSKSQQNPQKNLEIVQELGVIAVIKSHRTQIYWNDNIIENPLGNPSMATGGMGDTLAGMISGLVYQYPSIIQGVLSGVYLHSYIGDRIGKTQYVTLPSDIISQIPLVMKELEGEKKKVLDK